MNVRILRVFAVIVLYAWAPTVMSENRIDGQRPDAPDLAAYGDYAVGVRSIELTNSDQVDILQIDPAAPRPDPLPRYDRPLTVQAWYPAHPAATGSRTLRAFMRDAVTEIDLTGQAILYAAPVLNDGPFPLVIVSHGYPGNRFLLSHLAENIASKGYVVASIDHTDSTYRTQAAFGSTLVNRSLDQIFVLNEMARLNADSAHFLHGLVDASNTAVLGYSMGAYGAVITAGGGVTQTSVDFPWGGPAGTLDVHLSGSTSHNALPDARIKTALAFAPWGMNFGFWDTDTLQGIRIPMLFVAGSQDAVSGYETGTRAIWQGAINVKRALLTLDNAGHNAGAPYPAPAESHAFNDALGFAPFDHYADSVWDTVRLNNIAQHFVTAWLGKYLKEQADNDAYLDLVPDSNEGVWSVDDDGVPDSNHTYWAGFADETARGMHFEWLETGD
jgi:predicted dienelactone hydrolase